MPRPASGLLARLFGRALALYVRLVAATCRLDGPPPTRDTVVLAFWHEYNLAAAIAAHRFRRDRRHVSFSTTGFRGQVMNALLAALDAGAVPLPDATRRAEGARLSREMAALGRTGASLAVSPDGPEGPYRRAKPGALMVARASGLAIQPWAIAARPALRLRNRWDRHVVPLPFCRVRVLEGRRLEVDQAAPLRPQLGRLQAALDEVALTADRGSEPRDSPVTPSTRTDRR